jgi:integrase
MSQQQPVLEPTFADAIAAITDAAELPEHTRRHWCSSLRGIAKAFDQPLQIIPGRYSAVRARMAALHYAPLGWTVKTLANHRSNAKAALVWFARERDVLRHGVPLSRSWDRLRGELTDRSTRYRLLPLMRFCSGVRIEPEAVDEAVIDRFMEHRAHTTSRSSDDASRRILARLWNAGIGKIDGWPTRRLIEPSPKSAEGPAWEHFPQGLRLDIGKYLSGLSRVRKDRAGQRRRPCSTSTIVMRRRELVAAVRTAVRSGVPLGDLISLRNLIHPDVAEKIFDSYLPKDGDLAPTYTVNLMGRFLSIAHAIGGLDAETLQRLEDLRFVLEDKCEDGMTPKNLALIRSVLTDGVWSRVVDLPDQLMREARRLRHAPVRAAVLAQLAVAVAILTVAPIRLGNLAGIRLGENLNKPGGPDSEYWLSFTRFEVKNAVQLQFPLDEIVTGLINEYVHDFRPALLRGSNADWLFPGEGGKHKEKISFSTQIVERVQKSTGLRITVHQFRHAAGALILKHRPGEYELVRRILGHKSAETTKRFYLALETTQASQIFTDIIRKKLDFSQHAT